MSESLLDIVVRLSGLDSEGLADAVTRNDDVQWCLSELRDILNIIGDMSVDYLRKLVQADREGRYVVLPCKLHDKVFFVENGCVKETEVDSFHNWTSGRWKISTHTDRMYDHWKGYEIDFSGVGKTVFLSREAAEKALEMEDLK